MRLNQSLLLAIGASLAVGCGPTATQANNADVIVVGAGIGGLAAALEAEAQGARVLVIDASSVGGGHAVRAGGFALVDTEFQRSKGLHDSPDTAFQDLMSWGEDTDAGWARRYADTSARDVYDWLTNLGVKFAFILDTPQHSVPRFHFTHGSAVNAIVPMMRTALQRPRIEFVWNTEVTEILRNDGKVTGVRARPTRSNAAPRVYRAPAVVLATGGFESNLELVRKSWLAILPPPERLLIGAGQFATGSGLRIATAAGAALTRMDHQEIFVSGVPNPRDPAGDQGLLAQNPAAIWVDSGGRRFTNEDAPSKVNEHGILARKPATYWLVFDAQGAKRLTIRGAAWLNATTIEKEIIGNPAIMKHADSVAGLAVAAGLPPDALLDTVDRFNNFIDQKMDTDFGRLGPGSRTTSLTKLREPPFYALQLFPMTRKSMGGLAIDQDARVLDAKAQPIAGLFAAGEVTGVAGINGSFGGEGTFLGPSVMIGRIAARSAARHAHVRPPPASEDTTVSAQAGSPPQDAARTPPAATTFEPGVLTNLLRQSRPGYWHFEVSHRLVLERADACSSCHRGPWQPGPAGSREQRLVQLDACTRCH